MTKTTFSLFKTGKSKFRLGCLQGTFYVESFKLNFNQISDDDNVQVRLCSYLTDLKAGNFKFFVMLKQPRGCCTMEYYIFRCIMAYKCSRNASRKLAFSSLAWPIVLETLSECFWLFLRLHFEWVLFMNDIMFCVTESRTITFLIFFFFAE